MSTYKLTYFNGRGRAEVSRLIFAAAGQKYEDDRISGEQWAALKSQTPLGHIPVLEVDGVQLPQSVPIARFLAKQFHLAGKDNFEQAKVDAVADTISELFGAFFSTRFESDAAKKQELLKKLQADELPKHLQNLEKLAKLYGNGGPFFVGNNLTWADLFFYAVGQTFLELDGNGLDNHPWLKQNRAEVEKQPKIAAYLKNRPQTSF
jgi:glutathione S-transferase